LETEQHLSKQGSEKAANHIPLSQIHKRIWGGSWVQSEDGPSHNLLHSM